MNIIFTDLKAYQKPKVTAVVSGFKSLIFLMLDSQSVVVGNPCDPQDATEGP